MPDDQDLEVLVDAINAGPNQDGKDRLTGPVTVGQYEIDFGKLRLNKKMLRAALFSVLAKKLKDNEVKIFSDFNISEPKTKILAKAMMPILNMKKGEKKMDVLFISQRENRNVRRAVSNLVKAKALEPQSLNIYDVMNHKNIFMDKASVGELIKHYKTKS